MLISLCTLNEINGSNKVILIQVSSESEDLLVAYHTRTGL